MGRINWPRVVLSGLVGSVVIFVFEVLHHLLFGREWEQAMQAMGRTMEESGTSMVTALVLTFGLGISAVWLYAALRSRFGPGPGTAVRAAFAYWIIGCAFPSLAWGMLIGFPTRLLGITVLWVLPEIILATLAGAWLYKE